MGIPRVFLRILQIRFDNFLFAKRAGGRIGSGIFYFLHHIESCDHLAKNGVFHIKLGGGLSCNKELAAIGIWPGIGHGENSRLIKLHTRG